MKTFFSRLIAAVILMAGPLAAAASAPLRLTSPDGRLTLTVSPDARGGCTYALHDPDGPLISRSRLGLTGARCGTLPGPGWSVSARRGRHRGQWRPVWGKRHTVPDRYNELTLTFTATADKAGPRRFVISLRAYDDGVAFNYHIPSTEAFEPDTALRELTEYAFAGNYTTWAYNGEHHNLGPDRLTDIDGERQPVVTLRAGAQRYMALHEACLRQGNPLLLSGERGSTRLRVASAPAVRLQPGYTSAWRVVLYGRTAGELVDSHLIELLNPDPEGDFTWVRPGMAVWDWRINGAISPTDGFRYTMTYPSWVRMVDFAARQGFRYLVLDANWYGPEFSAGSHPTAGGQAADVRRIIRYGREKGVGIWLYLNDVGGRQYPLEQTLRQYAQWGAAGIKYGFMNGTPAEKNRRTQLITRLCAENRLMVDFHDGPVHPYGQMRTWPNALTREYCQAQLDAHRVFEPRTFVTSVFVNMLAGPIDMNNGMFDLRQGPTTRVDESTPVPSTVTSEAARTLITFSGITIVPDIPEMYERYPSLLRFLAAQQMPWRESRTLMGEIGQYIVMMRETDDAYLVAAATNEEGRTLTLPLTFLPRRRAFSAELTTDGPGAHYLTQRETCQTDSLTLRRTDSLTLRLAPGGGACLRISKR